MDDRCEAMALGIGNVGWADDGFGVCAVEALHAMYAFPSAVVLKDAGMPGVNLYESVASARRLLVLDAIDVGREPGTLIVLRGPDVAAWGRTKRSPHQTAFNDVLALAQLNGRGPETVVAVGVQPQELSDFGGSLCEAVRKRLPDAVALAARELALWGYPGKQRRTGSRFKPLNAPPGALDVYESGRPSAAEARRAGDARVPVGTDMRRR
jgi:hydrogenase maturation protease